MYSFASNAELLPADGILGFTVPPEREDYAIPGDPLAMDIDPELTGRDRQSQSEDRKMKSNLRLIPPPLFSRQGIPQNYKYTVHCLPSHSTSDDILQL